MNIEEGKKLIRFYMRQMEGGYYPLKFHAPPKLTAFVDTETAQRIYDEEIAKIEVRCGPLPRWDSDKNAPVVGTPKP